MWIRKTINEFRLFWKNYLFQSVLAVFALALAMLILNIGKRPVLIASVGATAFIAFAMPGKLAAKPKSIIGGHLIGFLSGAIFFRCAAQLHDWINNRLFVCCRIIFVFDGCPRF